MSRASPHPEFGKPETGQVRHWFRTDAQMRRHYMDPVTRERERQRISARRAEMKKYREQAEEFKKRVTHRHFTCDECAAGLTDVGAFDGEKDDTKTANDVTSMTCCTCLAVVPFKPGDLTVTAEPGPHFRAIYRCHMFDEAELAEEAV